MSSVHLASPPEVPEVDVEVVPKPKPIRKSRPQAPAHGIHGPLVLGFAFSFEELHKRVFELCDDINHLWPQTFKGWVRDPTTGNGMYVVGLSSNKVFDRLRMPTPAQAEKMQKILQCGEAQWYPDLNPPSKTNSIASICPIFKLYALI
ncbi:hypothetical protein F5051DRAFT_446322 [Lentinula edodes]|nr:hypothetical protein F5051DRAFT_446322 [Lentinula edodes]